MLVCRPAMAKEEAKKPQRYPAIIFQHDMGISKEEMASHAVPQPMLLLQFTPLLATLILLCHVIVDHSAKSSYGTLPLSIRIQPGRRLQQGLFPGR